MVMTGKKRTFNSNAPPPFPIRTTFRRIHYTRILLGLSENDGDYFSGLKPTKGVQP